MNLKFNIKKIGLGLSAIMAALSLFISPITTNASSPILQTNYLVNNISTGSGWVKSVTAKPGDVLQFYVGLHNTEVGTTAVNPKVKTTITGGNFTSGSSFVYFNADNATENRDMVQINLNPASRLEFISTTTRLAPTILSFQFL